MSYSTDNEKTASLFMRIFPWILLSIIIIIFAWYILSKPEPAKVSKQTNTNQLEQTWQPPRAEEDTLKPVKKEKSQEVVSYHDAVAKASQSVVNIYTTQKVSKPPYIEDPVLRQFFEFNEGMPQGEEDNTNLGSGVIVSADGYIVTNAHVVEKADEITVGFNDGRKSKASIVGVDTESDLAVIKVKMGNLQPLAFRRKPIEVGDVALAIGNPFGVGQTVTQGIISATGRTGLGVNTFEDFIQTDAAINPGNSGGALVDAYGELIGINTMIFSRSGGSMGIGFAIPTAIVEQVMNALIENGHVSRGWLGIEIRSQLKDPTKIDNNHGVTVVSVVKGGPSEQGGLQVGDIIIDIDGKEMNDENALVQYVARKLPNTVLNVQVMRDSKVVDLKITLAERPSNKELMKAHSMPNPAENIENNQANIEDEFAQMSEDERLEVLRQLLEREGN
ncbi:MAG: trypsin-like peptidase domain-containing protein [Moraxellaceae bacterium]|nr:trypsin-like peptidase domain-containing protein [Moraxellaceae bacterium]